MIQEYTVVDYTMHLDQSAVASCLHRANINTAPQYDLHLTQISSVIIDL